MLESGAHSIAVALPARRKGEGRTLLKAAIGGFRALGASRVFLEVRESNQAGIAFYTKQGFSRGEGRSNYYRNPPENAIVMEMNLGS